MRKAWIPFLMAAFAALLSTACEGGGTGAMEASGTRRRTHGVRRLCLVPGRGCPPGGRRAPRGLGEGWLYLESYPFHDRAERMLLDWESGEVRGLARKGEVHPLGLGKLLIHENDAWLAYDPRSGAAEPRILNWNKNDGAAVVVR